MRHRRARPDAPAVLARQAAVRCLAAAALMTLAGCGGSGSLPSASDAVQAVSGLAGGGSGSLPSAATQAVSGLSSGGGAMAAAQPALSSLGGAASSALSGLGSAPAGTKAVEVRLSAAAGANPSRSGQGQPVVVRIYQLAATTGFEGAEFYRLFNADAATLGSDLIRKDEVLVAPGATRTQSLALTDNVRAIGVFAALQSFSGKTWRLVLAAPARSGTALPVTITAAGLAAGN